MKMVAAAKLHRTQRAIGALVPYADELQAITSHLVGGEGVPPIALATQHEAVGKATVIAFASNGTLCGAYNGNVVRKAAGARDWNQDKTNVFGYTLRQYCTAIMEVCAHYGIPVLDMNLYSGMLCISYPSFRRCVRPEG